MITQSRTFRSIAESVVPEIRQIDVVSWQQLSEIVEHAIAQRPAAMRRQLTLFINALNVMSVMKYGRTLNGLIPSMRTEFLEGVECSRILLLRRGFWGLRTLILMGYYARPESRSLIGYGAHVSGWQAR